MSKPNRFNNQIKKPKKKNIQNWKKLMVKAITIGDDSAGLWRNLEFLGRKFENGGKRCSLGNAEPEIMKRNKKGKLE